MWKRLFRWKRLAAGLIGLVLLLNFVAWMHARAMVHFSAAGEKTQNPEQLSTAQKLRVLAFGITLPHPRNTATPESVGLPFSSETTTTVDGIEIELWMIPHKAARGVAVMFHGYAASKSALLNEAKAMHSMGLACVMADHRGAGGSSGETTTIGYREAEDVRVAVAAARKWRPGLPVILYGQSMGAAAVLRAMAHAGVSADAVILEAPFDSLYNTACNRFHAMGLPSFPLAGMLVFWGGVEARFNGFDHNPAAYARSVKAPVLLLHGDRDPRVLPEQAAMVLANCQGSREMVLFTAGHQSLRPTDDSRWDRVVSRFVESAVARR